MTNIVPRMAMLPSGMQAYMLDKLDTAEIEVVLCIGIKYCLTVYAAWCDTWVSVQLGTAPDEGQKLVVIQAPNPMRACGFQPA